MEAIARRLSAADRMAVSGYYSEMPLDAPAADTAHAIPPIYVKGDPSRGLLPCADCHGPKGEGLGPANPEIGRAHVYLQSLMRTPYAAFCLKKKKKKKQKHKIRRLNGHKD